MRMAKTGKRYSIEDVIREDRQAAASGKPSNKKEQMNRYAESYYQEAEEKGLGVRRRESAVQGNGNGERQTLSFYEADDAKKEFDAAGNKAMSRGKRARAEAKKASQAYTDYVQSEEGRKGQVEAEQETRNRIFAGGDAAYGFTKAEDEKEKELRNRKEYWGNQVKEEENQKVTVRNRMDIERMSPEERRMLEQYAFGTDIDYHDTLNFAQNGMRVGNADLKAMPLIQKYGQKRVDQLAETIRWEKNAETAGEIEKAAREDASKDFLHGAGHSIASVGTNVTSGIQGVLSYIRELGSRTGQYSTLDPNSAGTLPSVYSEAVRGQIQQNIEGANGENGALGKVGSILYQGGMSFLDNSARAMAGMGLGSFMGAGAAMEATANAVNMTLAATGTFTSTVREASARGASPAQAVALGTVDAAVDALTEKIPLDNLLDVAKGGKQTAMEIVVNALKQAGIEITTEEASLVGSTLADAAILRDKSEYNQAIGEAMANGMTYQQAKNAANMDILVEALNTAMVSGLSGAGMSAANSINVNRQIGKAEKAGAQQGQSGAQAAQTAGTDTVQDTAVTGQEQAQGTQEDRFRNQLYTKMQQIGAEANSPALEKGMSSYLENGRVTNKPADAIAADPAAVKYLQEKTGVSIEGTDTQKRNAVRAAVESVLGVGTQTDTGDKKTTDTVESPVNTENDASNNGEDENSSIKEQIHRNREKLNGMNPVADIQTPPMFPEMDKSQKMNWVIEKLRSTNYKVDRKGFGVINFAKKQLKSAFNYFMKGSVEEASFEALPYVLEHGEEISSHPKHKGRDYGTVTIAAPVVINGQRGNMAVVVKRTTENFYKVHRILTPDGSVFQLTETTNEAGPTPAGESPKNGSLATPISPASMENISQKGLEVNGILDNPVTEMKGTGAAEQNFSGKANYQELLTDENTQRDRPGDVRPMEVPKTDADGRKVSEFVGNAYGAEITPDRMANQIESLVQSGALSYDPKSNREALKEAYTAIYGDKDGNGGKGEASIRHQITRNLEKGKLAEGDIEKALILYEKYANRESQTSLDNASEIMVDLQKMATMSGRNLQLFRLMRQMTPEGQMMTVKKSIDRDVESMQRSGRVKKDYKVEIDQSLQNEFIAASMEEKNAKTPEQKQKAQEKVQKAQEAIAIDVAAKLPATFTAKWDAWRYTCMLGNPKTVIRNLGGNGAFIPLKKVKDGIGAALESKLVKEQSQRTKAVLGFSEEDKALKAWAKSDAKSQQVQDALKYSAKIGDDVTYSKMQENMLVFNNQALETVRKFTEKVTGSGDMLFKNPYYAESLAGFMKGRGYTAEQINAGMVPETVMTEARSYAVEEAMKATFNDCNQFSDFVSSIGRSDDGNIFKKLANKAAEGVLPFRRTPANILARFYEYSPVNMIKSIVDLNTKVKNGEMSAAKAIDGIASGLTGTGVYALGWILASGVLPVRLRGSGTTEDEKRQGHQDYSIEFYADGKLYSYTIDWCAPTVMPLFVAANVYQAMEGNSSEKGMGFLTAMVNGAQGALEPMLELSCLSGIKDLVESAKYSDGDAVYKIAANMATGYFQQGIPTILRQVSNAIPRNAQTTFANSEDKVVRGLQKEVAGLPFVGYAFKTDKRNAWGETEDRGNIAQRLFNTVVNPGNAKVTKVNDLETEIDRLNQVQPENVSPKGAERVITYTDKEGQVHTNQRLTEEQYQKLAQVQGQTEKRILESLKESGAYQAMTDKQKAKVFDLAQDYAREKGRTEAIDGYDGMEAWMLDAGDKPEGAIIGKVAVSGFSGAFDALKRDGVTGEVSGMLDSAYEVYSSLDKDSQKAFLDANGGRIGYFIRAKEKGIDTDTFGELYGTYRDLGEDGAKTVKDKAQAWSYALTNARNSGKITKAQESLLKSQMVFRSSYAVGTEKYDEMLESGLSARSANYVAEIVNKVVGTGKMDADTGKRAVTDYDKWWAITTSSGISERDKDTAIKAYMPDYDPTAKSKNYIEVKYDYAREELGVSPSRFVQLYHAYQEGDAAAEKKENLREIVRDEAMVNQLYNLFNGKSNKEIARWYSDR